MHKMDFRLEAIDSERGEMRVYLDGEIVALFAVMLDHRVSAGSAKRVGRYDFVTLPSWLWSELLDLAGTPSPEKGISVTIRSNTSPEP